MSIIQLPCGDGLVNVSVDNKTGEVIIWEEGSESAFYFPLDDWERINVFVLEQYKKMNRQK